MCLKHLLLYSFVRIKDKIFSNFDLTLHIYYLSFIVLSFIGVKNIILKKIRKTLAPLFFAKKKKKKRKINALTCSTFFVFFGGSGGG